MDSSGNISTFVYINKSDGAQFNPVGVAVDSADNVYTTGWNRVLKFTQNGTMTVVAGTETYGYADGVGEAAVFCLPKSLTVGSDGDLYVADTYNNCIRKISLTTNAVTTYAGRCGNSSGYADGNGTSAQFQLPLGIAAAPDNVFYVVDKGSSVHPVRKIYLE